MEEIHYFSCMTIKWIIFDAMGVIYTEGHDLHELLMPFIKDHNKDLSPEFIQDLYFETSLGNLSSKEFWDRLGFSNEYPNIEKEYLDTCLKIDPEFKRVGGILKREYSLALLSNDVKEWSEYLRNKFEINNLFKVIIISGDVGLRKPDVRIFHFILEKIEALPEECVFIDDNLYNLEPASRLGMKTIRFTRESVKIPSCSEFEVSSFSELRMVLNHFL